MTVVAETEPAAPAEPAKAPWGANALKVQIASLNEVVTAQAQTIADLKTAAAKQEQDFAELRSQVSRVAHAVGRGDLMTPPATVEQLTAAYKAGQHLLVLKDYKAPGGITFVAGTKIEARQYPLERMVELVEQGKLALSVVKG